MYSNWRIKELKDELRKRGASLRGNKADLVERLEFYDQNFNFGRPESADDEDPKIQLTLRETYRDINSNTVLPPLDKTMIRHYLSYSFTVNWICCAYVTEYFSCLDTSVSSPQA